MSKPLFSIVLPAYNAERYIDSTIKSVLQQTLKDWELVIVDDGSTDLTLNRCHDFSSNDPRIIIISKSNGGVSSARNRGLKEASGKYVTFIDADDLLVTNYLESLEAAIKNSDFCAYSFTIARSKEEIDSLIYHGDIQFDTYKLKDGYIVLSQKGILHSPVAKCYLNKIIKEKELNFDESIAMGEDLLFNLSYLEYCDIMSIGQNSIYYYLTYNSTLSKDIRSDYADLQIEFYNKREEFCKKHNIEYSLKPHRYSILYDAFSSIAKAGNLSSKEKHDALNRISASELVKDYLETSGNFGIKEHIFRLLLRFPILNKLF